jgi:6-phosphogluconolactonase (cycloisomerase 2 family)
LLGACAQPPVPADRGGPADGPTAHAAARTFAYVGGFDESRGGRLVASQQIDVYAVDAASGGWTAVGSAPGYGSLAIDGSGRFLFVGHWGERRGTGHGYLRVATLSSYSIDPESGRLEPAATFDLGDMDETFLFVHPTRPLLYVADQSFDGVRLFDVASTPAPLGSAAAAAPRSVAVDPLGRFVYVAPSGAHDSDGSIEGYALRQLDGGLTPIGKVAPGGRLVVARSGRFAYAARPTAGTIAAHALDAASGQLPLLSSVAAGDVDRLALDPTGRFLFECGATPAGGLLVFRIEAASGKPTSVGRFGDGACDFLAVDPSGQFLYVSRAGTAEVAAYRLGDGVPSLLGPVRSARAGWIGFASSAP